MNPEYSRQIEQLYLEMFDKLISYARYAFREECLAEEAVQEAFRIACQKPDQLCESANPKGWLVNTLKFTILNMKRNRGHAQQILSSYIFDQKDRIGFSEDKLSLQLMYEDISDLEEFMLIKEMVIDGRSYLEMANARGISVSACKKRVQRAKERLQKKMKQGVTK